MTGRDAAPRRQGRRRLAHATHPGFELVDGLDGYRVAGLVYGYTLPPDTLWWEGLHPDPGPELTREHPGRTVGVCELLVTPAWRRLRLGHTLVQTFLGGRDEDRAAGFVAADNEVMLAT